MLNIIIIILVLIGLTVHRYLTSFWEIGQLPYSIGFLLFAHRFAIIYLVSFIWMFGIFGGIVISLLCFFQVIFAASLWIFHLPLLINMYKSLNNQEIPRVNTSVYGSFSLIVISTGILTIINFFVSPYKYMLAFINENFKTIIIIFIFINIIGNIARIIVMSKFIKNNNIS